MAVRFLMDYRGKLTAEAFFTAGTEETFGDETEKKLIAAGRAVEVGKKSAGSRNKAIKPTKTK